MPGEILAASSLVDIVSQFSNCLSKIPRDKFSCFSVIILLIKSVTVHYLN